MVFDQCTKTAYKDVSFHFKTDKMFWVCFIISLSERAIEERKEQFLREISFMQRVGTHRNVLNMIGYWDRSEPIMLILEYVPQGDLLQWLRNKRLQVED